MVPEERVFVKKAPVAPGEGSGAVWPWEEPFLRTSRPGRSPNAESTVLWKFKEIKPVADFFVSQTYESE